MHNPSNILPPWSFRKRIVVAVTGAVIIFLVSYIVGYATYAAGTLMGLFTSQSVKALVLEELKSYSTVLGQQVQLGGQCTLSEALLLYWQDSRWRLSNDSSSPHCSSVTFLHPMEGLIRLHLKLESNSLARLIDTRAQAIEGVVVSQFPHSIYQTTLLTGRSPDGLPYNEWLLTISPNEIIRVYYTGGNQLTTLAVEAFIQTLTVTRSK